MTADPFADYRPALEEALTRALDSISTSHAVLLSHQLAGGANRDAGLLCLLTADALGAASGAADPPAVALSLLDMMGATFASLDDGDAALARYGMPRSLNAGDGFYALAQSALLHAPVDDDAEQRLAAVNLLDTACREYADELHVRLQSTYTALAPALLLSAVALGALMAGVSSESVAALEKGDFDGASLPPEARAKIEAALQHEAPGA